MDRKNGWKKMNVTCIGSGVFGMAIATLISKNSTNTIYVWTHDEKFKEMVEKSKSFFDHGNSYSLNSNIFLTTNLKDAIPKSDVIFLLVSTPFLSSIVDKMKVFDLKKKVIYIGTKGMIETRPYFFTEFLKQNLSFASVQFFCGPNLSIDLLKDSICSMTFSYASKKEKEVLTTLFPKSVLLHFTKFSKPLELASTLKNIYAMGSGMIQGFTTSKSTLFTYLSFSYFEFLRILKTYYYLEQELIDITGDFFLTGTMEESRNLEYGKVLMSNLNEIEYLETHTVEGKENLHAVKSFLQKKEISTPLFNTIDLIIQKEKSPDSILEILKDTTKSNHL